MSNLDNLKMQEIASDSRLNLAHKLPHNDFVNGVKDKSLEYIIIGNEADFLSGSNKQIFVIFIILYAGSCLLTVPLMAYFLNNWWLLFGIPFSYLGVFLASIKSKIPVYFLLWNLFEVYSKSWALKDYDDFFYICVMWGYVLYLIAENSRKESTLSELTERPELYQWAIEKNRIIVTKTE